MTRKRFVKLLMADGYSRNHANSVAASAQRCGMKYSNAYNLEQALLAAKIDFTKINIDAMCEAIRQIVDMATKVSLAIAKAAGAFAKAFRENMEVM